MLYCMKEEGGKGCIFGATDVNGHVHFAISEPEREIAHLGTPWSFRSWCRISLISHSLYTVSCVQFHERPKLDA